MNDPLGCAILKERVEWLRNEYRRDKEGPAPPQQQQQQHRSQHSQPTASTILPDGGSSSAGGGDAGSLLQREADRQRIALLEAKLERLVLHDASRRRAATAATTAAAAPAPSAAAQQQHSRSRSRSHGMRASGPRVPVGGGRRSGTSVPPPPPQRRRTPAAADTTAVSSSAASTRPPFVPSGRPRPSKPVRTRAARHHAGVDDADVGASRALPRFGMPTQRAVLQRVEKLEAEMKDVSRWRRVVDSALQQRLDRQRELMGKFVALSREADAAMCEQEKVQARLGFLESGGSGGGRRASIGGETDGYRTARESELREGGSAGGLLTDDYGDDDDASDDSSFSNDSLLESEATAAAAAAAAAAEEDRRRRRRRQQQQQQPAKKPQEASAAAAAAAAAAYYYEPSASDDSFASSGSLAHLLRDSPATGRGGGGGKRLSQDVRDLKKAYPWME